MKKQLIMKAYSASRFVRKILLKTQNRIKVASTTELNVESIHFRKNTVTCTGENNTITCDDSFFQRSSIYVHGMNNNVLTGSTTTIYGAEGQTIHIDGNNNSIIIGKNCIIRNSTFFIWGSDNTIVLADNISAYGLELHIEQDNNYIYIGEGSSFHGRNNRPIHINVDESTKVEIGKDCMFSNDIQIWTTDSHSIVNCQHERINPAEDIIIADHCWISLGAIILKGTTVPMNCIVGAGAVCCKKYDDENSAIAGNPAKVVKRDVSWDRKYL